MQITETTYLKDLWLHTEDVYRQLWDKVPEDKEFTFTRMTIGEFALASDFKSYCEKILEEKPLIEGISYLKAVNSGIEKFSKWLEQFQVKQSPEEKQAAQGVKFPSLVEQIYIDCVSFFHLHSFDEVDGIQLSSWMMIKKSNAANSKFERNYNRIINEKMKQNGKKR